ncbi:MAG: HlyD family secretion protein [Nitrososphaera sp.]|nr:HlyD family secretion protein [Nitrososphaera sp.]
MREEIDSIDKRLNEAVNQEGATYVGTNAVYTSIFDGVITKVHVDRGQIIPAGAPLVTLVRESASLEGHAFVENKDIGHLKRGQEVKIKYFAYPYQEYGIATGLISDIATTPSGLPEKESRYLVKIVLRNESISKLGGKPKQLEIGLEGVAEIKTGDKRFVEILFSPISKFFRPEEESV